MGKLLRSYFFWSYERGSIHFDMMVTLILIFLFVSPHVIDFKDRPVETVALHGSEVLVKEAGRSGTSSRFVFQIRSDQAAARRPARPTTNAARRSCRRSSRSPAR